MKELKLLIVEDDPKAIVAYQRGIKAFNIERKLSHENDIQIKEIPINNKEEAITELRSSENSFDAAIVDLDLLGQGGQDSSGNEVIREIKNNLRFPVFVISGTIQHIDGDLKEESSLFKIITRGEEGDYLTQIVNIYNTGITQILNKKGKIENHISEIFWTHLSNSLNLWVDDNSRTPDEKEESLLRYTLLHMLEYLDEEKSHPSEFYITEPVKQKLSTGDLISFDSNRYIVLTPACDFAIRSGGIRNVKKAFLLRVKGLIEEFPTYDNTQLIGDLSKTFKGKLEKIIGNNSKPYFHFIPKHNEIEPGLIDFQDKRSIPISEIEESIKNNETRRIATISSPFLKDLIERYSSYYSRQGSPDFNTDEILTSLFNN
jgi:CheY-like chemotaxis protein